MAMKTTLDTRVTAAACVPQKLCLQTWEPRRCPQGFLRGCFSSQPSQSPGRASQELPQEQDPFLLWDVSAASGDVRGERGCAWGGRAEPAW